MVRVSALRLGLINDLIKELWYLCRKQSNLFGFTIRIIKEKSEFERWFKYILFTFIYNLIPDG